MSLPSSLRSTLAEALRGWPPPVLDPAGPGADAIAVLTWVLVGMAVLILGIVIAALTLAIVGKPRLRGLLGGERLVWIGGLALPVVVLSAILVYGLWLTSRLSEPSPPGEMRVRVTGEMWWWRVAYLDPQGREVLQDANEVHIPAGRTVTFEVESADVIHSFWVPQLGGKIDMIPGRRNLVRLKADRPGVFAGQCAEYCGGPHALMGFMVIAHEPAEFEAWRAARQAGPAPPADPLAARGAEVFAAGGCGACHTIRGTPANGLAGPDLSGVGSRLTLGAGILPNNRGTLAGWVSDSQAIKPGNRMPPYKMLTGQDLQAIAAYLESRR